MPKPVKPPLDRKKALARLQRAQAERLHVSIRRWAPDADRVEGFVVAVGAKWVAIAASDDRIHLNGWCVLRLKDIQAVRVDPDPECFIVRALRARGEWPPSCPELDLDSASGLIDSVSATAPLMTVFQEFYRPDFCWIGVSVANDGKTLRVLEVSPRATWRRKPMTIDLDDVTRVDFGGDYEGSLALVAGPAPTAQQG
jgi:hypothetical protein